MQGVTYSNWKFHLPRWHSKLCGYLCLDDRHLRRKGGRERGEEGRRRREREREGERGKKREREREGGEGEGGREEGGEPHKIMHMEYEKR